MDEIEWDEKVPGGLFELPIIPGLCFLSVTGVAKDNWCFRLHMRTHNGWAIMHRGYAGSARAAMRSCLEESDPHIQQVAEAFKQIKSKA